MVKQPVGLQQADPRQVQFLEKLRRVTRQQLPAGTVQEGAKDQISDALRQEDRPLQLAEILVILVALLQQIQRHILQPLAALRQPVQRNPLVFRRGRQRKQ